MYSLFKNEQEKEIMTVALPVLLGIMIFSGHAFVAVLAVCVIAAEETEFSALAGVVIGALMAYVTPALQHSAGNYFSALKSAEAAFASLPTSGAIVAVVFLTSVFISVLTVREIRREYC